jgi:two-component system, sensor histidine kinase PdtaS
MTAEIRKTGIGVVGDMPWGAHLCHFYETKEDLLDILLPYFKAGLENNEFCLWLVDDLISEEEARSALRRVVPEADRYLAEDHIEIIPHTEWYFKDGALNLGRLINGWNKKLADALAKGYAGLRANGNVAWLLEEYREDFSRYEKAFDEMIGNRQLIVLCSYPLSGAGAAEILDVVNTHQFAVVRRRGDWEIVETRELRQTKDEIKRRNEELEHRVAERTRELVTANEKLRREIVERKQAEEQLKQSESQLADAQRLAHVGSWNWDLQSNALSWSEELYRIFGVDPQAFNPAYEKFVTEFVHAEDRALARGVIENSLKTRESFSFYNRILRPDGEERVIHVRGDIVSDEHGKSIRVFGTAQDVTERKRAEEALRESQRRLKAAQRLVHVGHYEHDLETGVIVMSDENYHILGLQPQESITLSGVLELMHPEDRARVHQVRDEAVRKGQHFNVEFRMVRPDGEVRYIHSHGDVIRDEQGRARRTFGVAQDITERKWAEDELKKEKEILEKIFDNIPVMIGFVGEDSRVKLVNPQWERTIGWTLKELQEQNVDIFAEAYPDLSYRQEVLDFVAAATGEWVDLKIKVRDGRVIDVACAVVHLSDGTRVAIAQDITERKLAEEALKESRRRLEEAQRIAHVGHWERDLRTGVITWSDEVYRILGLERQVSPPTVWEHMIHPEDRERISLAIEETQRGIGRYDVEYRIVRPDGEVRFLHSQGDIIRDEQGRPLRAFGIAQDVTERKQAEALLHARSQEFRAFVENTPDQVIKYDREFRRVYVNPAVAKAYDLPVEALVGKPIGSVIGDAGLDVRSDQLAQIRQRIEAVFDSGESSVYELTWQLPTGRRYYSIRYFPEFDLDGVVIYVWGISRDITELKETQHQILALTENSPDLIARFDRNGRYLYSNSAMEKLLGVSAHELRGRRIGETLSARLYPAVPIDVISLRGAIDKVFASGSAIETEIQVLLPAGERNFDVRLIPERDEAGQVSSVLHIGRDITERKRAGEMLQTFPRRLIEVQEAERRRVARELHDEIGQALTAIKLNLQAVEQSPDTSPLAQQLNESAGIVDRALQQVRDLSFNLRPSLLDDLGLIAALRWYVDREAQRAELIPEFVADLSETRLPSELETACFRITQEALTNVVRHAQARRMWVELRQRGAELHLKIRDDGIGFEVDVVWRRRASDGGLGLQGMQERALILGGRIEIKSAPTRGTEVHVWFPLPGVVAPAAKNELE